MHNVVFSSNQVGHSIKINKLISKTHTTKTHLEARQIKATPSTGFKTTT